uniref:Uncharacterized protein n=1 Tax=Anguilla anguilla TaxID=7936 RepID=A0A0E9RI48_ANGAN
MPLLNSLPPCGKEAFHCQTFTALKQAHASLVNKAWT